MKDTAHRRCSRDASARRGAITALLLVSMLAACGGGGGGDLPPTTLFSSAAVADLDGDGLADVAAVYTVIAGPPPHPGFVAVYLQDRNTPGRFLPAKTYGAGNDPVSIAIGDLDGDGRPDIVVADAILATNGSGASVVSVLLQDTGHPGQFQPAATYPTGFNPVFVAIADVDGDGRPDLAVADDDGVSLLLQSPAVPGTFRARTVVAVGEPASSVAIADVDADGKLDVVATTATSVVVVLQDPQRPAAFGAPARYLAGAQPIHVAVGDLDGDGKPDLAVANLGSPADPRTASVSILLQDPALPGTFAAATNHPTSLRSRVSSAT